MPTNNLILTQPQLASNNSFKVISENLEDNSSEINSPNIKPMKLGFQWKDTNQNPNNNTNPDHNSHMS